MTKKHDGLFPEIFRTIRTAKETIAEGADLVAKLATDSEVLSQVPLISTGVKLLNIKDAFARHRFERNVIAFLKAVENADSQAIDDLSERIQSDPEFANEFTDTVLSILLEGQKPVKSELIGRLVVSLSLKCITMEEFESLSQIVQAATSPSLHALPSFFVLTGGLPYHNGMGKIAEEPLLFSLGIAYRSGSMFRISTLGEKLYVHGFGGRVST